MQLLVRFLHFIAKIRKNIIKINELDTFYLPTVVIMIFYLSSFALIIFQINWPRVLVAGAQPNVSPKDINSFVFKVPVSLIEQKKIGGIFSCLDEIITLHQRE